MRTENPLKRAREAAGMSSQTALAKAARVPRSVVRKIESGGYCQVAACDLIKLAQVLDKNPAALITREQEIRTDRASLPVLANVCPEIVADWLRESQERIDEVNRLVEA